MSLNDNFISALLRFSIDLSWVVEKIIEKYSITIEQYFLLSYIYYNDGVRLDQLSKDKPYKPLFYRNIDYLHKQKIISKRHGRKYKKLIYLHPTAYGEVIMGNVGEALDKYITSKYSDRRKLKCLTNLLENHIKE